MRPLYLLITLSLSLCLFTSLVKAQAPLINTSYDKDKKTTAKVTALFSKLPMSGYMPLRLEVTNAQKIDREWTLTCISSSNPEYSAYDENSSMESKFTYSCSAGESKTFDILVPLATIIPYSRKNACNSNLEITLSSHGKTQYESIQSSHETTQPAVILTNELFTQHASTLDGHLLSKHSSSYRSHSITYAASAAPKMMPTDWKAYSAYDALVCTDTDWSAMSKEAQNAILEWNRLGARIVILRLNSASNFKTLDISQEASDGAKKSVTRSFGSIEIIDIAKINDSKLPDLIRKQVSTPKGNTPKHDSIVTEFNTSKWSIKEALGKIGFNPTFLILILIGFGVLVGPVNLFVFAKSGQRHKLFITTPVIALGASLLLILIIILQDGFGGYGNRIQLIEVRADNGENKAYIKQEQVARTGVVLGSAFETSSPTYITPVPVKESRYSRVTVENEGGNTNYIASHGENGLSVSGDWFQSRSEHGHYLESVISTRGRISLKNNTQAPTINSSFDYPIDTLIFRDESGVLWASKKIKSGNNISLTGISEIEVKSLLDNHAQQLTPTLSKHLYTLSERNGHFIAFTKDAPAIDTLHSINWQNTTSIITGPVVK